MKWARQHRSSDAVWSSASLHMFSSPKLAHRFTPLRMSPSRKVHSSLVCVAQMPWRLPRNHPSSGAQNQHLFGHVPVLLCTWRFEGRRSDGVHLNKHQGGCNTLLLAPTVTCWCPTKCHMLARHLRRQRFRHHEFVHVRLCYDQCFAAATSIAVQPEFACPTCANFCESNMCCVDDMPWMPPKSKKERRALPCCRMDHDLISTRSCRSGPRLH